MWMEDGIDRPSDEEEPSMADTFTQILFHAVFSTKHRTPLIDVKLREELNPFMADTVRRHGGKLVVLGGMPDHVHFLLAAIRTHLVDDPLPQDEFFAMARRASRPRSRLRLAERVRRVFGQRIAGGLRQDLRSESGDSPCEAVL
jgi:hypothetical protein